MNPVLCTRGASLKLDAQLVPPNHSTSQLACKTAWRSGGESQPVKDEVHLCMGGADKDVEARDFKVPRMNYPR